MSESEDKLELLLLDVARFRSIVFDDFMQAFNLTQHNSGHWRTSFAMMG